MKKILFFAFAAAAMVSCSNDEVVDLNREAIGFGDAFVENSTRSIDPSYSTEALTQFNVWGSVANAGETAYIPVFANDNVEGTVGTGSVWNCTTKTQYWIAGRQYHFAAVVNGGSNFTLEPDTHLPVVVNGFTSNGTTDLLYANTGAMGVVGKASGNDPVNFTFKHMLAKVQFTVQNTTNLGNSNNSGYYYKVTDVKINDIYTVGDCNLMGEYWENVETPAELVFGNVTNVDNKANEANTDAIAIADRETATTHYARMVIPYDYGTGTTDVDTDDLSVSFTLDIYEAGGDTLMATENVTTTVPVEFVAGNAYNFVIKKAMGEPIQFSVTNAPTWANGTAPDINI